MLQLKNKYFEFVRKNVFLVFILSSILFGFGLGIWLKNIKWDDEENKLWFTLPGKLFIRSLELFIIPIVFFGVVTATSSMSLKNNVRITLIGLILCLVKHLIATLIGLCGSLIMISLSPQTDSNSNSTQVNILNKQKNPYDILADILRNLLPRNIIRAGVSQELTIYVAVRKNDSLSFARKVEYVDGANVLGILFFGRIRSSFQISKNSIYFL